MQVIKRDGKVVDFDRIKIEEAIQRAGGSHLLASGVSDGLSKLYLEGDAEGKAPGAMSVEQIQADVVRCLYSTDKEVASKYDAYMQERNVARERGSDLLKGFLGIVEQTDKATLNENANKAGERAVTQRDLITESVVKRYVTKHLMPKDVAEAHLDGTIHYHDAGNIYQVNCCLVDLPEMFEGFTMGNAQLSKPNSIATAMALAAQVLANVSSANFGGTSYPDFDLVMEPYLKKSYNKHYEAAKKWVASSEESQKAYAEEMTLKELKAAVQSWEYEVNTLHSSSGQSPFVTVSFGRGTGWFCREIQKALLNQRLAGLGKDGITPVFPKLIFFREDGVNKKPKDPNYDIKQLAVKCSAKRLYPDWVDVDKLKETIGGVPTCMG